MSCAPTKTSVGEIIGKNPGSHRSYAILRITNQYFGIDNYLYVLYKMK